MQATTRCPSSSFKYEFPNIILGKWSNMRRQLQLQLQAETTMQYMSASIVFVIYSCVLLDTGSMIVRQLIDKLEASEFGAGHWL